MAEVSVHERFRLIRNWSLIIQEHKAEIAEIMTLENGMSLNESLSEVDYATNYTKLIYYLSVIKKPPM
ncbi:aldehyde dehydrogenase family protein [Neobacillus sp. PS3-12]|uniref:aldehyde dehydrogenase family protein n=1 Tax=Neobacillus sp. PS3-12 TaxID=3070677 RepID=UPI0027E1E229|nr:aldehyde dehydrogenase family protein [Neobacillus sp. PS3-12]WML53528.1 aldehyde dehydrogenase family protein [Neobacillus sp. PS3-12]